MPPKGLVTVGEEEACSRSSPKRRQGCGAGKITSTVASADGHAKPCTLRYTSGQVKCRRIVASLQDLQRDETEILVAGYMPYAPEVEIELAQQQGHKKAEEKCGVQSDQQLTHNWRH